MGHQLYNLPTALVSNTLDYGKFDILETTDYLKNTMKVWEELGFTFDAISTGFIVSEDQAKLVADFCRKRAGQGTRIFVDPIMGDEGKLYNGVTEATVGHLRRLVAVADVTVPNYTEAAYLAGVPYQADGMDELQAEELLKKLRELGARSVIVTSARINGQDAVIGYDDAEKESFLLPFEMVPVRFPGTGDIFSSVLMGKVLSGCPLKESTQAAMDVVRELIWENKENADKFKGIPVESYLEVIK